MPRRKIGNRNIDRNAPFRSNARGSSRSGDRGGMRPRDARQRPGTDRRRSFDRPRATSDDLGGASARTSARPDSVRVRPVVPDARPTADPSHNAPGNKPGQEYSRESIGHYRNVQGKRKRRFGLRVLLITLVAAFVLAGGVAFAYVSGISAKLNAGIDSALRGQLTETSGGDPFYMLLIGIDKSWDREESSDYGSQDSAYRTDSILLARIDPTEKQVTLVSIHRDTLVNFGSDGGKQKINAAYSIGAAKQEAGENTSGAAYTVKTISEFAGVPISHYAEIDFDQFVSVVDAIGGVEVNVPVDVYDPEYTGADIKAGYQTINGGQALQLCRARHAYDKYGDGDVYRAANQRMVIGAILKKLLASDVGTITNSVNTLAGSVNTDLSVQDILSLATTFRGFNADTDMFSGMEPTNSKYVNDTWYEICDTKAWQKMMTRVNKGLSPYESESEDSTLGVAGAGTATKNEDGTTSSTASATTEGASGAESSSAETDYSGTVKVLNGAGVNGLAGRVASSLNNQGFDATASTADSYDHKTTSIYYVGSDNKAKAQAVADTLGLGNVKADDGTYKGKADVVVVLGADMANS